METKFNDIFIDEASLYFTSADITKVDTLVTTISQDFLTLVKSDLAIKVKPVIRQLEYAGSKGNKNKGDERITGYEVSCEGEGLNFNVKLLSASLMVKDSTITSTKYDCYVPKMTIDDTDYKSLVIIGTLQGATEKGIWVIENTYNDNGFEFAFKENDEGATKFNFTGHFNGSKAPLRFFKPKATV